MPQFEFTYTLTLWEQQTWTDYFFSNRAFSIQLAKFSKAGQGKAAQLKRFIFQLNFWIHFAAKS